MRKVLMLHILFMVYTPVFSQYMYVNPLPGSREHMPNVTITLNPGSVVNRSAILSKQISITGSLSGRHTFEAILSGYNEAIILKPEIPFTLGEKVSVSFTAEEISKNSFSFFIRKEISKKEFDDLDEFQTEKIPSFHRTKPVDGTPAFKVLVNNNPAPGSYFFSNKDQNGINAAYMTIIDNDNIVQFSRQNFQEANDWKMNDNGMFTFFDDSTDSWVMLDSAFNSVDSFVCGNGYDSETNGHEFRIYSEGYSYIEAYDHLTLDMSSYVPGGDTAADVIGFVLQKLDADHNVVFEWRSWDHFQISDAVSLISLTADQIDYCHGNSIEQDEDGNLLLSFRTMSEITKVNGVTGDIIWRLGGENNQFSFINDIVPSGIFFQHYARWLPDHHLILFNNANLQSPQESSAKEYLINEENKTATLVWHYTHPLTNGHAVYSKAGGNAQRLPNGNTLICWGLIMQNSGNPNFTEVDSAGNIVYEMKLIDSSQFLYRVAKNAWEVCQRPDTLYVSNLTSSTATLNWNDSYGALWYEFRWKKSSESVWNKKFPSTESKKIKDLAAGTSYDVYVKSLCDLEKTRKSTKNQISFVTPARLSDGQESNNDFLLYPNPSSGSFAIALSNLKGNEQNGVSIEIQNMMGQILYTASFDCIPYNFILPIELGEIQSGVYSCIVRTGEKLLAEKLNIQK